MALGLGRTISSGAVHCCGPAHYHGQQVNCGQETWLDVVWEAPVVEPTSEHCVEQRLQQMYCKSEVLAA